MAEKMTIRKALEYVLENYDLPEEVEEKMQKLLQQTIHKVENAHAKPTAKDIENENLRAAIIEYLKTTGERLTCTQLIKTVPEIAGFNPQKVTGILRKPLKEGVLGKELVKANKTEFFYIPQNNKEEGE